jgi:hypothetical protein
MEPLFWNEYVLREDGTHCIAHIVHCKMEYVRSYTSALHLSHSHKWRHAAAGMRAHNVLCNSY